MKRTTLADIVKYTGLSNTTVYNVLHNRVPVSKKTAQKVYDACEALSYSTNKAASFLAKNTVHSVNCSMYTDHISHYNHYVEELQKGINDAGNDNRDFGLNVVLDITKNVDPKIQSERLLKRYKEGVRHFLVLPSDEKFLSECIDYLVDNGSTVFTVNMDLANSKRQCYFGADYKKSGSLAASVLCGTHKNGIIAMLLSPIDDKRNITMRREGIYAYLQEHGGISYREYLVYDNPKKNISILSEISKTPNIIGVIDLAGFLDMNIEAYNNMYGNFSVPILTYDCSKKTMTLLAQNKIIATVDQSLYLQSYKCVTRLFEVACDKTSEINPTELSPLNVVFKENMDCRN